MSSTLITPSQFALIADIEGDEQFEHLPVGEAMRITMAILRKDSDRLRRLAEDYKEKGWACFLRSNGSNYDSAESWKKAWEYADIALRLLDIKG